LASTVNTAFEEFMKDAVRLDPDQTRKARASRDNLISNLDDFSGDDDFFTLNSDRHLKYGSFARRTKIRPLDDIDLMICIRGDGRTYSCIGDTYYIHAIQQDIDNGLVTDSTNYLNSTKVINRFIKKLSGLNDYSKAEMHKNQEAATLKLKSYDWNFDIVPCGYMDIGKYLIPDGSGNWKVTDPRIDNDRTIELNQNHKGKLLEIIRIMKYWNKRAVTVTMGSYLLECMILDVYEGLAEKDHYWVDLEFRDLLYSLSVKVFNSVNDPKGIQGDLNNLSQDEREKISSALSDAYDKACEASKLEMTDKNQETAIQKWGEILGYAFPDFS